MVRFLIKYYRRFKKLFTKDINKSADQTVDQIVDRIEIRPTINAVKLLKLKFENPEKWITRSTDPENEKSEQSKYFTFLRFVNEYRQNEVLPERKFIQETLGITKRTRQDLSKQAKEDNIFLKPKENDYIFNINFSEHKIQFLG